MAQSDIKLIGFVCQKAWLEYQQVKYDIEKKNRSERKLAKKAKAAFVPTPLPDEPEMIETTDFEIRFDGGQGGCSCCGSSASAEIRIKHCPACKGTHYIDISY